MRSQVTSALHGWLITYYDQNGFCHGHPQANYFAGYYAAKAYAALAIAGDSTAADIDSGKLWDHFLNKMHYGGPGAISGPEGAHAGVQWYYSRFMAGGGWSEGWGYGGLGVANMVLPTLAVKTATGLDFIQDGNAPYTYPLENGLHMIEFAWPSRLMLDDRDLLRESTNIPGTSFPARPSPLGLTVTAYMLGRWNHALAPQFHAFAREVRNLVGVPSPWVEFLFWNDSASEQAYNTLPRSYFATGLNAVAMRSDWLTSATWGSFRASGYVDCGYAGEQFYDAGGLAVVKGGTPLLANATGVLVTSYPGPIGTPTYEDVVLADVGDPKPRKLFNTFMNGTGYQEQFPVDGASPPATRVTKFEDGSGYVRMRGESLQAVYTAASNITSWTRDVVYLRPSAFVVYDRTTVANTSGDQHMSWHLMFTPAASTPPAAGTTRYDVTSPNVGFVGAATTVLPAGAGTQLINVKKINNANTDKVYRLEVRPAAQAVDQRWLTVFETAASPAAVSLASALSSSANVKGVLLTGSTNSVALFGAGAAATNISGAVTFTEPAAATKVVVTDLAPSSAYSVTAAVAGSSYNVTIQPGNGFTTTANGTLYVNIAAGGGVSAGN